MRLIERESFCTLFPQHGLASHHPWKLATAEKKHGLMLRLPKGLHTALRHYSIDRGTSLNTLITEVLEEWWKKQPERSKYKA